MGDVVRLAEPLRCGIAIQGGAALCAFNAGAIGQILKHTDIFLPIAITGTSAGGLNALKTVEACHKGIPVDQALRELWHNMAQFQRKHLSPLHYGAVSLGNHAKKALAIDLWHQTALESCARLDGMWGQNQHALTDAYRFVSDFLSQSTAFFVEALARPQRSKPLLAYLTQHPFDFEAINASAIDCTVNASRFDERHSIWALPSRAEILFSNRMEGGLDLRHALASGSLHHMMPPETIDGADYHDGGYLANPNLMDIASKCNKAGAILFVLRTRPTHAYQLSGELAGTAAWASAFFNKKLDDDLRHVRGQFPYLRVCVIEPDRLETGLINGLTPEMQFSLETVDRRFENGRTITRRVLQELLPQISPVHHRLLEASDRPDAHQPTTRLTPKQRPPRLVAH